MIICSTCGAHDLLLLLLLLILLLLLLLFYHFIFIFILCERELRIASSSKEIAVFILTKCEMSIGEVNVYRRSNFSYRNFTFR